MEEEDKTNVNAMKKALDGAFSVYCKEIIDLKSRIASLEGENRELLDELKKSKLDQSEISSLRQVNKTLQGQLSLSRKQLDETSKREESLTELLCKERARVSGWKRLYKSTKKSEETLNKEIIDTPVTKSKNHCLFLSPQKSSKSEVVYALAPMTEQFDDHEDGQEASEHFAALGETEFPKEDFINNVEISSDSSSDSDNVDEPSSPSILTGGNNFRNTEFNFKKPAPPLSCAIADEIVVESNIKNFDTSGDLFAESSPIITSTCIPNETKGIGKNLVDIKSIDFVEKINEAKKSVSQDDRNFKKTKKMKQTMLDDSFFTKSFENVQPEIKNSETNTNENTSENHNKEDVPKETRKKNNTDYKYAEVVRNKEEREKLNGYTCHECEKYYASDNLTKEEMKGILKQCSKHRHRTSPPPSTPDDFWSVGFPTSQEYIDKGYMVVEKTDKNLAKAKSRKRIKYQ